MNSTQHSASGSAAAPAPAVLQPSAGVPVSNTTARENPPTSEIGPKQRGYGLPCSKCRTYYVADVAVCPVCKNSERVSPITATIPVTVAASEPSPDPATVEEERERFLQQFKSEVYASHMQINTAESFRCSLEENHEGSFESASVCQSCYKNLQGRTDLMEAALHMDLKEASQVIYDAVWTDPSDPTRTYQNAAQAILTELRKRAGISAVMGPLQTLAH
jgi:hypothetical protein